MILVRGGVVGEDFSMHPKMREPFGKALYIWCSPTKRDVFVRWEHGTVKACPTKGCRVQQLIRCLNISSSPSWIDEVVQTKKALYYPIPIPLQVKELKLLSWYFFPFKPQMKFNVLIYCALDIFFILLRLFLRFFSAALSQSKLLRTNINNTDE